MGRISVPIRGLECAEADRVNGRLRGSFFAPSGLSPYLCNPTAYVVGLIHPPLARPVLGLISLTLYLDIGLKIQHANWGTGVEGGSEHSVGAVL